jgi:hypothetical protein
LGGESKDEDATAQWTNVEPESKVILQDAAMHDKHFEGLASPTVKPNYSKVFGYEINPVDNAQGNDNGLIDKDLGLMTVSTNSVTATRARGQ